MKTVVNDSITFLIALCVVGIILVAIFARC